MRVMVMHFQQIAAEHALRVDPDGVGVVGAILGVVVFDKRARAVDAEIMRAARH